MFNSSFIPSLFGLKALGTITTFLQSELSFTFFVSSHPLLSFTLTVYSLFSKSPKIALVLPVLLFKEYFIGLTPPLDSILILPFFSPQEGLSNCISTILRTSLLSILTNFESLHPFESLTSKL